ncbi:MAG: hypothetical protein FJ148_23235 [Deltaproteobacteria bacterium]|nr:hypothetical protein [Deltaproteobacteria bacterium]
MTAACCRRLVALALALVASAAARPARAEAPRQRAGIVPLELAQVAGATGTELATADTTLAGKRVRFTAKVAETGRTPAGEAILVLTDGGARVVFRMPDVLERAERLTPDVEWEVIARLDRPVQLADGRAAIAVMPDILVKTPGLPAEEKPTDVIAQVVGATMLVDPPLVPFESEEPLYRMRITDPGKGLKREFTELRASALASAKDDQGRTMYNAIRTDRAEDGRERTTSCIFRSDGGELRMVEYGEVEVEPATGRRSNETGVNLENEQFNDTWSARKRSFERNTYAGVCMGTAISGFPLGRARVVRIYVYGGRGIPVPVYAYQDGEETLDVRGRPERATRIRMGLDVRQTSKSIDVPEVWRQHAEAGSEVWFSGESTYWIASAPPHEVLKFEGPLGPPGAPEAVVERIR